MSELADSDYRVRELRTLVGEPQNLVSYHLRLLRDGGLVTSRRSTSDGRDSYYRLDLDRCAQALADIALALHPALHGQPAPSPPADRRLPSGVSVLFSCTGNSARSPIAEALLRHRTGGQVEVASAGSRPKSELHPSAVQVLRDEYGIDVSGQRPRHLDSLRGHPFDYVITLCDKVREVCPDFPGHPRRVHWSTPDPAPVADTDDAGYPVFRRIAADIDTRIRHLLPRLTTIDP